MGAAGGGPGAPGHRHADRELNPRSTRRSGSSKAASTTSSWSRAAERAGYGWVSCPEHIAIPGSTASARGGRYWDPLTTLSFVAAVDAVHRAAVARRGARLPPPPRDREALRHPRRRQRRARRPRSRGGIASGRVRAARRRRSTVAGHGPTTPCEPSASSFSQRVPSYSGTHYRFSGFVVDPSGVQRPCPHLGGRPHPPIAATGPGAG